MTEWTRLPARDKEKLREKENRTARIELKEVKENLCKWRKKEEKEKETTKKKI